MLLPIKNAQHGGTLFPSGEKPTGGHTLKAVRHSWGKITGHCRRYFSPYSPSTLEWLRSTCSMVGGVTNPNKYRRIYISSLSSEGHTLPGLWRNRNSMWRYIKGVAAQSRIVTIRAPLEIRRIILDEKLSEFRSNGPPRGNLVIIFESSNWPCKLGFRLKSSETPGPGLTA